MRWVCVADAAIVCLPAGKTAHYDGDTGERCGPGCEQNRAVDSNDPSLLKSRLGSSRAARSGVRQPLLSVRGNR